MSHLYGQVGQTLSRNQLPSSRLIGTLRPPNGVLQKVGNSPCLLGGILCISNGEVVGAVWAEQHCLVELQDIGKESE